MAKFLSLVLAVCLLLTLTGCPTSFAESGDWTTRDVTITFYHGNSEESEKTIVTSAAFREMVNIFKAKYPNVTINETIIPTNYNELMLQYAAADALPMMFSHLYASLDYYAGGELTADITDYVDPNVYIDKLASCTYNGRIHGLNMKYSDYNLLYYNEAMLKEATGSTEFPKTLDEFLALDEYFAPKGISLIANGNKGKWMSMNLFINSIGYELCGKEWMNSMIMNEDKHSYTDDCFVDTLKIVGPLSKYFIKDYNSVDGQAAIGYYMEGDAFTYCSGGWATSTLLKYSESHPEIVDNTRCALWPSMSGKDEDRYLVYAATETYAINSKLDPKSDEFQACMALMKQICSEDYATYCAERGTTAPIAVPDIDVSSQHPMIQDFIKIHNYGYPGAFALFTYLNTNVSAIMQADLQLLFDGSLTPEQMAADCQDAQQQYMDSKY